MFLRQQEAEDEHHETGRGNTYHSPEPALLRGIAAEEVRQGFPKEQGEERTTIGKEHTERGEDGLLVRVIRHDTEHGSIRHVDTCVDRHHQDIGDVSPDEFRPIIPIRGGKQQDTTDGEQRSHPEQIRAVLTPLGIRTVTDNTHHRVGDSIPDTGDKHQYTSIDERQSEDVRIEERQIVGKDFPEGRR